MDPLILAIDTSCDETSAAVTSGRRVLSNVISSQITIHQKYGGVFPALAKRAHQERIAFVIAEALKRAKIKPKLDLKAFPMPAYPYSLYLKNSIPQLSAIAVTYGPGLAVALEVGIAKAKAIAKENSLPLIAVNHLEGHIYSCLADNSKGVPYKELVFPALCLIVSGGHTETVLMKKHGVYEVIGATLDDACGEALDKAAKILKLGYPGGPIIEKLAEQQSIKKQEVSIKDFPFNRPLREKTNLNFSYSGLKTQLLYLVQKMNEEEFNKNLLPLAASFQQACFEQVLRKVSQAVKVYQPKTLVCGGGVISNKYLRKLLRNSARSNQIPVLFPPNKNLITDNAAMIGVAAGFKFVRKEFVENPDLLDREPRLSL